MSESDIQFPIFPCFHLTRLVTLNMSIVVDIECSVNGRCRRSLIATTSAEFDVATRLRQPSAPVTVSGSYQHTTMNHSQFNTTKSYRWQSNLSVTQNLGAFGVGVMYFVITAYSTASYQPWNTGNISLVLECILVERCCEHAHITSRRLGDGVT